MNSNDEAVEAFIVDVLKRADIQRHIPLPDDERDAYNDGGRWEEGAQAVRLLQAGKIIAAVRAEAVADERRRIADELEDLANKARAAANTVVFASSQSRLRIEAGAYDAAARLVRTAAGSVPVATPELESRS